MPILYSWTRSRQPQGAIEVNWGSPLARGLLAALVPVADATAVDAVTGLIRKPTSGTGGTAFDVPGRALSATTTSDKWTIAASDTRITSGVTALAFYKKRDTTNRSSSLFGVSGASSSILNTHAPFSDGTTYWDFGGNSGANRVSAAGLVYSRPTVLVFSGGAAGMQIVQDGVVRASNTTAVSRTVASQSIQLGFAGVGSSDLIDIYAFLLWDRQLTLNEQIYLSRNPWQVFAPLPRRVWAPSGSTSDVTVALSGIASASSAGTLTTANEVTLLGSDAIANAGTVTPTVAITAALSGQAATTSAGTTAATLSTALLGQAATTTTGTLSAGSDVVQALSGVSAAASAGAVVSTITTALSGSSVTSSAGTVSPTTDPTASLSGTVVTAQTGSVGVAVSGSVALSGQAAAASAGTTAATLSKALGGQATTAATGTATASILAALSGSAATVSAGTLVGTGGTITQALSGQALAVSAGTLVANSTGPILVALSGSSAIISAGTLIGIGGTFVWTPVDDSQTPNWTPVIDTNANAWTPVAH